LRNPEIKLELRWVRDQISELVQQHENRPKDVDERDLLRASGALSKVGIDLGMYRRSGIDCPNARFALGGYPVYGCPVEIEEYSSGFLAKHHRKHREQRVVLMCMFHDEPMVARNYVDVLELRELSRILTQVA
jgi:hypothetical protein